jgi:hypothetical protein
MHSTGVLHRVSRGHDGWQGFAGTWASGATGWTPVPLFGSTLISGAWYASSAQGVIQIPDPTKATYYVAYTYVDGIEVDVWV